MDTLKVSILKHSYTPAQSPNTQTGFLAHGLHISSESKWTLARHPALSLFPRGQVPLCFLLSPTATHSPHQAPKTQGPGKSVKESLCLQTVLGFPCCCWPCLSSLALLPGIFSEVSSAAVGEVGLWGDLVCASWIHIISVPSLILVSHCIKLNDRITWFCLYCVPEQVCARETSHPISCLSLPR